jgi:amino acid adenylation domain-containing protein
MGATEVMLMSDQINSLAGLTPAQLELLRMKLSKVTRSDAANRTDAILRRVRTDKAVELSFAQQRVWFFCQLAPDTAAYNIVTGVRLKGLLNFHALAQAFGEVSRRHEILRTTFTGDGGQPGQVISAAIQPWIIFCDLRGVAGGRSDALNERLADEEAGKAFSLSRGPLWRVVVLRTGESEYVMLLTMHHIIADYWSLGLLIRETAALYEAYAAGRTSALRELPIQYSDYALWQRDWLHDKVLEEQLSYWKQKLEAPLPTLNLLSAQANPQTRGLDGGKHVLRLSGKLTDALRRLSRRQDCTTTMTLLAGFLVLLHRLTGQDDFILGMTIANRNRPEIEELVGFFVNTLALRSGVKADESFQDLMSRVRGDCLDAYAHQDLPFEKLVEEIRPERRANHHPFFDILFNSLSVPLGGVSLPGLAVTDLERGDPESKFLLTLNVEEVEDQLSIRGVYQSALLSAERVGRLFNQYRHLLEQITDEPTKKIGSYSLVTSPDSAALPNPLAVLPEPPQELITAQIAGWASRMPEGAAIRQGGVTWSYSQLDEAVTALSRTLVACGVRKGETVAVTGQGSFGLIAAMVAVLKAGAVLMPLDPNLPSQRKSVSLRESDACWIVSTGDTGSAQGWEGDVTIISVDPATGRCLWQEALWLEDSTSPSSPVVSTDDPAYIFFTSGTTGVPKGVLGSHKGLSHFLRWQREEFEISPQDRCAQLTGLSFDVVLRDIFLPLTSGATLCLPDEKQDVGAGEQVLSWLDNEQVTLIHTVPSLAQAWLNAVPAGATLRALRYVFFAGEPLRETLILRWRETFPQSGELVNLYGPTETTLAKCCYRIPAKVIPGTQPLGMPLPQSQALVLNELEQLCGIDEPGQIAIRTPFRSLGYVNAESEMRRRFVRNPFGDDPSDIIYLTGDRGRYRSDGTLEILGRIDQQIKVRGVRIEPDEISSVLSAHPLVAACVVLGKADEAGQTELVAYVVTVRDMRPPVGELRSHLSKHLPQAMIPSHIIFLEELPLTPNGKVDRKALPEPSQTGDDTQRQFIPPASEVELAVAEIWKEVLHVERVGALDDFFSLGGHSLLATRVVARIRDAFRIELQLSVLFESPTLAGLSSYIEGVLERDANDLKVMPDGNLMPVLNVTRSAERAVQEAQNLSDEEVDQWLADLLK